MGRIESLVEKGVSDTGREALLRDVDNLLNELNLLSKLPTLWGRNWSERKFWFDELHRRLRKLKQKLK